MENLTIKKYDDYVNQLKKLKRGPVVIKISGKTASNLNVLDNILRQIIFLRNLGINIILVHGAGPQINTILGEKKLDEKGERITFPEEIFPILKVCRKISFSILKRIEHISQTPLRGWYRYLGPSSLLGVSRSLNNLSADFVSVLDLKNYLRDLQVQSYLVRKSILLGSQDCLNNMGSKIFILGHVGYCFLTGKFVNINADNVAGGVAKNISASKLLILGTTNGVLDKGGSTIGEIKGTAQIEKLYKGNIIHSGMLPKIKMAAEVASQGIDVHIMPQQSNKYPDLILQELLNKRGVPDRATLITIFRQAYFT